MSASQQGPWVGMPSDYESEVPSDYGFSRDYRNTQLGGTDVNVFPPAGWADMRPEQAEATATPSLRKAGRLP